MATLHLVRHGQASFGAENYDVLSPLGQAQAAALGDYWAARGTPFAAAYRGSLHRHAQTLASLGEQLAKPTCAPIDAPPAQPTMSAISAVSESASQLLSAVRVRPALNEYDSDAILRAQFAAHPPRTPLPAATTPEGYKAHFRVLRDGLSGWIQGELTPVGMPSFAEFRAGIAQVIDEVRAAFGADPHAHVLLVSSGGPIATAVMHVLGAPPASMIELNYQMRNTAVTTFQVSKSKVVLSGFNALNHLDGAAHRGWVTST